MHSSPSARSAIPRSVAGSASQDSFQEEIVLQDDTDTVVSQLLISVTLLN